MATHIHSFCPLLYMLLPRLRASGLLVSIKKGNCIGITYRGHGHQKRNFIYFLIITVASFCINSFVMLSVMSLWSFSEVIYIFRGRIVWCIVLQYSLTAKDCSVLKYICGRG